MESGHREAAALFFAFFYFNEKGPYYCSTRSTLSTNLIINVLTYFCMLNSVLQNSTFVEIYRNFLPSRTLLGCFHGSLNVY